MEKLCQCNVCFEAYESTRKPKVLPCGHTLCETCIEEFLRRNDLQCTECSQPFSDSQSRSLPTNYALLSENESKMRAKVALSATVASIQCNLCENGIRGTRYVCIQCKNFDLCQDCFAQRRHRIEGHTLLKNPHEEKVGVVFVGLMCAGCHGAMVGQCFKCLECSTFLCRACRLSLDHPHPMEIITNHDLAG